MLGKELQRWLESTAAALDHIDRRLDEAETDNDNAEAYIGEAQRALQSARRCVLNALVFLTAKKRT
jgi:hypothetical protein